MTGTGRTPPSGWVLSAERAAFDGEQLVLLDRDAQEIGRLVRVGDAPDRRYPEDDGLTSQDD